MRIPDIVKMKFGSHLYGLNTQNSDMDYKGVFMPSIDEILLGRIPKCEKFSSGNNKRKNSKSDVDVEIYSLHYFIKLACEGQTVALDMLHTPQDMVLSSSPLWDNIVSNRSLFYTKNLHAFIGYARRQAIKYGIKGGRLDDAKKVVDFLSDKMKKLTSLDIRLGEIWGDLPSGEYIFKNKNQHSGLREYEVCGRKVQETASIEYSRNVFNLFYEKYGDRAKLASENKGIDWKAVSHAMRAAYQVKEIFTDNTITFPMKEREYLKSVKLGSLDYMSEVSPRLEYLIREVEVLSLNSDLPEKVDRGFWDDFIVESTERVFKVI